MSNTSDQDRLDAIATAKIMLRNFHIHKDSPEDRALAIAKMIGKEVKEQILDKYYKSVTGATCMDAEPDKVDARPEPDTSSVASNEASTSGAPYSHINVQINTYSGVPVFGAAEHTGATININTDGRPESLAQAALAVGQILSKTAPEDF